MTDARAVVVGAGLAGLSASIHLRRAGIPHRIFERERTAGGLATTVEDSGYRFDRTGHLLHLRDEGVRELVLSTLEPGSWVTIQRRSAIYSNGVYTRYPFQANTFGLPKEIAYACVAGFVEAAMKKLASPGPPPANFEEFCLHHFGRGISEHFMLPYNRRLWGVEPREISAAWCERFVPIPTVEDVIAGAVGLNDRELGYNASFIYPRLGAGELPKALAERANPIDLAAPVDAIAIGERAVTVRGERVAFEALVSSIPLKALVDRITDAPDAVREAASKLRATPLFYLDVALNTPAEKPYHWIYVPEDRFPFYRVGCYSHFSAAMAPPGKAGLYVELVDRAPPDLAKLVPEVAAGLTEMGILRAPEALRFARLRAIDPAYVVFDDAHAESVATIEGWLTSLARAGGPLVVSTGRYGRWRYASMEDSLIDGRDASRKVIDAFGSR
ncbi:MAG: FAD-dependent oxidoreductase [Polyangiaceae bacterium]